MKGPFNPKYIGDYHVVSLKGNQVQVRPSIGGPTEMKHVKHYNYYYYGFDIVLNGVYTIYQRSKAETIYGALQD